MKKTLIATLLLLANLPTHAETKYIEKDAEFSSGKLRAAVIYDDTSSSNQGRLNALSVICTEKDLQIKFISSRTLFPDQTTSSGMLINTTHRFDTQSSPETEDWYMPLMKYKAAYYAGDATSFAKNLKSANKLSIRFNKRNDIFRFNLNGSAAPLTKVISACTSS